MNEMLKKLYLDAILRPGASKSQHPKSGISRRRRQSVQSEDAKLSLTLKHQVRAAVIAWCLKLIETEGFLSFHTMDLKKKKTQTNKHHYTQTEEDYMGIKRKDKKTNKRGREPSIFRPKYQFTGLERMSASSIPNFSRPILPIITQRPLETITTIEFHRRILLRAP